MERVERGIDKIADNTANYVRPKLKKGLKGTRYSVEFPINGPKVDAYKLITMVEDKIKFGKAKFNARVTNRDSFV